MSSIKRHLWEETNSPTAEEQQEYELYCWYKKQVERYETEDILDFFAPLMEEE